MGVQYRAEATAAGSAVASRSATVAFGAGSVAAPSGSVDLLRQRFLRRLTLVDSSVSPSIAAAAGCSLFAAAAASGCRKGLCTVAASGCPSSSPARGSGSADSGWLRVLCKSFVFMPPYPPIRRMLRDVDGTDGRTDGRNTTTTTTEDTRERTDKWTYDDDKGADLYASS